MGFLLLFFFFFHPFQICIEFLFKITYLDHLHLFMNSISKVMLILVCAVLCYCPSMCLSISWPNHYVYAIQIVKVCSVFVPSMRPEAY